MDNIIPENNFDSKKNTPGIDTDKVYEIYKNRLLDISGRNKLVSFKLTAKGLDLYDFVNFDVFNILKNNKFDIDQDDYVDYFLDKNVDNLEGLELDKFEGELVLKFKKYLKVLRSLEKENSTNYKETGKHTLYLSYCFLSGRLYGDTMLKIFAPLFLIPVKIDVSHSSFKINIINEEILINRTILIALQKTLKKKFDLDFYEISDLNELSLEDLILKIEELGIKVVRDLDFKKFPSRPSEIVSDKFVVFNHLVLNNINISNSIFNDYVKMDCDINQSLELLLDEDLILNSDEKRLEEEFKNINITNKELSLISKLDTSQETAVYMAKKSNNLVIYGPPGTGKSETILNIISDSVKNNKRILVISEKKAAINVLYNRLMGLQKISLMFDRSNFNLNDVKESLLKKIEPFYFSRQALNTEESLSNIENCYNYFDNIYNILNIEYNGRKISDWYGEGRLNSDEILSVKEKFEYSISKNTKIKKFFDVGYSDFLNLLDRIVDHELINTYKFANDSKDKLNIIKSLFDNDIVAKDLIFELYDLRERRDVFIEKFKEIEQLDFNKEEINKDINSLPDINVMRESISSLKDDLDKKQKDEVNLKNNEELFTSFVNTIDNIYNLSSLSQLEKMFKDSFIENNFVDRYLIDDINIYFELHNGYFKDSDNFMKRFFNKSKNQETLTNCNNQKDKIIKKLNKCIEDVKTKTIEIKEFISSNEITLNREEKELESIVEKNNLLESKLKEIEVRKNEINADIMQFTNLNKVCDNINNLVSSSDNIDFLIGVVNSYKDKREQLKNLIVENGELLDFFDCLDKESLLDYNDKRGLLWSIYLEKQIDQIEILYEDKIKNIKDYDNVYDDYLNYESFYFKNVINDILINSLSKREDLNVSEEYLKLERTFRKEIGIKRRTVKLRQFMDAYFEVIQNYFPIILATPDAVSKYLPLTKDSFDIVIFDEASQLVIENAIPSIYRSKKVIVVGDDKQLKPSSFFKTTIDVEDELLMTSEEKIADEEMLFLPDSLTLLSLLDIAKTKYNSVSLLFHYRSRFSELINFSNVVFYKNQLKLGPNILRDSLNNAIDYIRVDGKWKDNRNETEAKKVIELLKNIFANRKNNETIGIITFNIQQKNCIDEEIEKEMLNNPDFNSAYSKEANRFDEFEDESIFVKNIENVQGDERDIIIFSVGYSYNDKGKVPAFFGPLSLEGGENRLNVAVSRAKKKIYVISSFEPEDLDVEDCKHEGSRIFKDYLIYSKYISEKRKDNVTNLLNKYCSGINLIEEQKFDNPFEKQVYNELVNMGYIVDMDIGSYGYKVNMGIYDEEKGRYVLGIECDDGNYHNLKNVKDRDIARQAFLESRGWNIHRIWGVYWWKDKEGVLNKIKEIIDSNK